MPKKLTDQERTERQEQRKAEKRAYMKEYRKRAKAERLAAAEAAKNALTEIDDPSVQAAVTNEKCRFSKVLASQVRFHGDAVSRVVIVERMLPHGTFMYEDGFYRLKVTQYHYFDSLKAAIDYAESHGLYLQQFPE